MSRLISIAATGLALAVVFTATPALADDCESAARNSYPDFTINDAVRSMKPSKALEILATLHERGDLVMTPAPVRDPAKQCSVVKPRPSDRISLGAVIAGVELKCLVPCVLNDKHTEPYVVSINNLDVRNALGLYRLVVMLKEQFHATTFFHIGIGNDSGPHDGRAIDFGGIQDEDGNDFLVLRDWGKQPVRGNRFRLAGTNTTAERLFRAVYEFARKYYNDNGITRRPTQIGDMSEVCHPDHPDPGLRATHQNHVHMDISVIPKSY